MESTREILVEFLELYKSFKCLWDITDPKYSNKDCRNTALNDLLEQYKKIDSTANIASIKKKLENMRAAYKRERKKVQDSESTGSGSQEIHVPILWYYDHMRFLDEKDEIVRTGRDSLELEEAETESSFPQSNTTETVDNPPTKKRRTTSSSRIQKKQEALMDAAQALLTRPDEPTEAYAHGLALQLNQMSYQQRCIAERLIADVLFHGKMSTLSFQTTLVGTNRPPPILDPNNLYENSYPRSSSSSLSPNENNLFATLSSTPRSSPSPLQYSVTPSTNPPFIIIEENNPVSEFLKFTNNGFIKK